MLTEERFSKILSIINSEGSATAQHLMNELGVSESTIRRDLNTMDQKGLLIKVHGGAIAKGQDIKTFDEAVNNRKQQNTEQKIAIAKYAASLIDDNDFVYIDAGTTTELMIDYIQASDVTFVTNAFSHAKKLSDKGYTVYILGGEFKSTTEAIVGEEAVVSLDKYNFTKGFWGTNAISQKNGFTTPDVKEAMVKKKSMECCSKKYILADGSKFNKVSSVKFADFEEAYIITENPVTNGYENCKNILEV